MSVSREYWEHHRLKGESNLRGNGEDKRHGQQIKVEVPPDIAPQPANFMYVTHTPYDFTIDFAHLVPSGGEQTRARVSSRIVMSPAFMHRLVSTLVENIRKYEATFGSIPDTEFRNDE